MSALFQADLAADGRGPAFAELSSRMQLEFELARARSAPSALSRITIERLSKQPPERRARWLRALGGLVQEHLPRGHGIAAFRDDELVVWLGEATLDEAETFARALIASARKAVIDGEQKPVRVSLSAGIAATRPGLDAYFETLNEVAGEGMRVALSAGGEACVHSELYELVQKKLERTQAPRAPVVPIAPAKPAAFETSTGAKSGTRPSAKIASTTEARTPFDATNATASKPANPETGTPAPAPMPIPPQVPGLDLAAIEAKMMELARAAFDRALAEQTQRFKDELHLYERRLAKMQSALQESETEKDRLARARGLENGVASVYRDVQGLSADEAGYDKKIGLLAAIAEANLDLYRELRRASA